FHGYGTVNAVYTQTITPSGEHVLKRLRRPLEPRGRPRLVDGDADAPGLRRVHLFKINQVSGRIYHCDGHRPSVLHGLGEGGGSDLLRSLETNRETIRLRRIG